MKTITLTIDGKTIDAQRGSTVAAAILSNGTDCFRRSITGKMRMPLCGMGVCFECRLTIEGLKHQRSCQILIEDGMMIETDELS